VAQSVCSAYKDIHAFTAGTNKTHTNDCALHKEEKYNSNTKTQKDLWLPLGARDQIVEEDPKYELADER
jgi:hypothetical protein